MSTSSVSAMRCRIIEWKFDSISGSLLASYPRSLYWLAVAVAAGWKKLSEQRQVMSGACATIVVVEALPGLQGGELRKGFQQQCAAALERGSAVGQQSQPSGP